MGLFDEAISVPALRAGLERCVRNGAAPGADGVTVEAFETRAESELALLASELATGAWRPRPARVLKMPKPGGEYRQLVISSVRDRVVQHAVALTLASSLDGELHPSAFAWRRGRHASEALAVIDRAMNEGREWVFRGDIEEFFDRIPQGLLLAALEDVCADRAVVELVQQLLEAGMLVGGQILDPSLGTGQGSPVSPFLANLYLRPFDRAVEAAGFGMVRYGDDFCVATTSRDEATSARELCVRELGALRLRLNEHKAAIRHRGEGFVFLGFQFDVNGRRASARARKELSRECERLVEASPQPPEQTVDRVLQGWSNYYGSLVGVELPSAVRARAEAIELERAERVQLGVGAGGLRRTPGRERSFADAGRGGLARESGPREEPVLGSAATDQDSRWQSAAVRLAAVRGSPDEAALERGLQEALKVSPDRWPDVAEALARFDGPGLAEVLASMGRFGEADLAQQLRRPPPPAIAVGVRATTVLREDSIEAPRFSPGTLDAERLLSLFAGCEGAYLRDARVGEHIARERVLQPAGIEQARAHLGGHFWLGIYPLRRNNTVCFSAARVVVASKLRGSTRDAMPSALDDAAGRLAKGVRAVGLEPVHSVEPGRARLVWVLFREAIPAARARALWAMILQRVGALDSTVSVEVLPAQDSARWDKPGTGVLLPLGLDPRRQERAWFCDDQLVPVSDPCAFMRALGGASAEQVAQAVGLAPKLPLLRPKSLPVLTEAPKDAGAGVGSAEPGGGVDGTDARGEPVGAELARSPAMGVFVQCPRALDVYNGCNVVRHFVDEAVAGHGLGSSGRILLTDTLGRLGAEATPALDAVLRHLDDWRPGLVARQLQRMYPHPTSCGRIRERMSELTAQVGCDCRFRLPPGSYPTPALHAVGAADVPGLGDRVRAAAGRGGIARAVVAAMNEGRKELGAKASALCARLADLRRQARVVERAIESAEKELDAIVEEAGDTPLETPSGTLKRVVENGKRRFVLEV